MRPPPEQSLDIYGTRTDQPARNVPKYGVSPLQIFAVATALGLLSTTLAWQFTRFFGKWTTPLSSLVILNFTWWYVWALVAPAVIWLAQHFQVARGGLLPAIFVHVPAAVVFSFMHIAGMQAVHWWLARYSGHDYDWWTQVQRAGFLYLDWEMMTYWAIVGLSHALLYYRESREREVRAAQLETKLVAAQLQTLQQQLHPHFLFNTLHAISSLMHRDVNAADRVLVQLSDLLRITLEHLGQQEVPLGAELDALQKYVDIERTRFADRLVVRFDIQPETLDTLVPSLLLQPLVENAIKYGVARKAGPGHIDISSRRDGDKLRLEVRDDGIGLTEDALTALHKGIGVSATRARLQHLFGADFRFEFHRLTQGLAVVVALPWRRAGGGGGDVSSVPASSSSAHANGSEGHTPATAVEIMPASPPLLQCPEGQS